MTGVFPLAQEAVARSYPPVVTPSAFQALIESADSEMQFLVEITTYRGGESRSGGLWTLAEGPLAAVPGAVGTSGAGQVTLLYADKDWAGAPSDADKPNTYYEGRATVPIVLDREVSIEPEQSRRVQRQFGAIEIANGDGEMDAIVQSFAVDGWPAKVFLGPYMAAYSSFKKIADVLGVAWAIDAETVRLSVRESAYSLALPLQATLFAGTGGAEGGAEIKGKTKPLLFGTCRNVMPYQIDTTNLIYQVHDGKISAVSKVYDRGVELTDSTNDAANYTALAALSVSAGQFATCLAEGLFKVGSSPGGLITADVLGDADATYTNTLSGIALRILKDRVGVAPSAIIDSAFVGAGATTGAQGLYMRDGESGAEAIDALMASVGGWWGPGRDGRLKAGRLTKPEDRTPTVVLDEDDIVFLEQVGQPTPRWRQKIGYQRNWTVQTDLAASVSDDRKQFLAEQYRVVSDADATVKARHQQALDPDPLLTTADDSADAATLATHLLALHSIDRQEFECTVQRRGYGVDIGTILRIGNYSRYGLSNGKNFYVVGVRDDGKRGENILRLWG